MTRLMDSPTADINATLIVRPHPVATEPADHPPSAILKRAAESLFVVTWSVEVLRPRLPFRFPVHPHLAPSPKTRYRSEYRYPGPEPLFDAARRQAMSGFEVSVYLIDFSPLEPLLAQHYRPSVKGQVPFHPVSMFLAVCLREELKLSWRKLEKLLAGDHGAGWRTLLGFREGDTPSASGLRYFSQEVGPEIFAQFCPGCIQLLREQSLCPERSTYPGDPPERGITLSEDGMLHPARHRHCCQLATDECYQPLPTHPREAETSQESGPTEMALQATAKPSRPCRARQHGLEGCACDTPDCQEHCRRASTLDPQARFVHYEGNHKRPKSQETKKPGRREPKKAIDVFGYRSIADCIIDDRFAVTWIAQSYLQPANAPEHTGYPDRLAEFHARFPDLRVGECLGDSGLGYTECLDAIRRLEALRMIDIRADDGDDDLEKCLQRGYDGQGRPLCPHGYRLHYNGYDAKRRRAKWMCRQACRREPQREGEPIRPVVGCGYLEDDKPLGYVVNVGRSLSDGCVRLAREIPYDSQAWKARYGRRNHSESRNSQTEGMDLKELRSYGLERNEKEVRAGDFVTNLRTLGRLVQEASALQARDRGG